MDTCQIPGNLLHIVIKCSGYKFVRAILTDGIQGFFHLVFPFSAGRDLNPGLSKGLAGSSNPEADDTMRNPDRPSNLPLVTVAETDDSSIRKRVQRVTSPEKWELKQVNRVVNVKLSSL